MDVRNRGWLLTLSCQYYDRESIEKELSNYSYYVYQLEQGEQTEYNHYQLYLENDNAIKFSTLKNKFPKAHIEQRLGSKKQAYAYCTKEDTRVEGYFEHGSISFEDEKGKRNDLQIASDLIYEGQTVDYVIENYPSQARNIQFLERVRQVYLKQKFGKSLRQLEVIYIYGGAGQGKTRYIYDKHGYENVYRVTDYKNPFDLYDGQDILVFEEFRSNLTITEMLNYLDIYPTMLKSRYANKIACYTKVYILTNIPITGQYVNVRLEQTESYKAFLRRINKYYECCNGIMIEKDKNGDDVVSDLLLGDMPF